MSGELERQKAGDQQYAKGLEQEFIDNINRARASILRAAVIASELLKIGIIDEKKFAELMEELQRPMF